MANHFSQSCPTNDPRPRRLVLFTQDAASAASPSHNHTTMSSDSSQAPRARNWYWDIIHINADKNISDALKNPHLGHLLAWTSKHPFQGLPRTLWPTNSASLGTRDRWDSGLGTDGTRMHDKGLRVRVSESESPTRASCVTVAALHIPCFTVDICRMANWLNICYVD